MADKKACNASLASYIPVFNLLLNEQDNALGGDNTLNVRQWRLRIKRFQEAFENVIRLDSKLDENYQKLPRPAGDDSTNTYNTLHYKLANQVEDLIFLLEEQAEKEAKVKEQAETLEKEKEKIKHEQQDTLRHIQTIKLQLKAMTTNMESWTKDPAKSKIMKKNHRGFNNLYGQSHRKDIVHHFPGGTKHASRY